MNHISYDNTENAIYDPYHKLYGDPKSLDQELERTFDLCNSCRLCFKYCPSFPSLFEAMDRVDADPKQLREKDISKVVGECFHCHICYIVCPYTESDEHPYKIDFPNLMLRTKIFASQKKGIGLRERLFGNPDVLGRLNSGKLSSLVNWVMQNNPHRALMHKVLRIHKKKKMPLFHKKTLFSWFRKFRKKKPKIRESQATDKVVLFSTCFVQYNNPAIGKDALSVLEKNNLCVEHPKQNCCGMPALESGNLKLARKKMKANIHHLLPYVEKGYKVLAINPTCSLTLKEEYEKCMPPGQWREKAKKLSKASMDMQEYLNKLRKEGKLNTDFQSSPEKVAYHVPCHLRAQSIGFPSRDVLKSIPETTLSPVAECCGHNGTWAMKKEYFEMSLKVGKRAFDGLKNQNANEVTTDCPLASIQLQQGMEIEKEPVHPIQVLAKAYHSSENGGYSHSLVKKENNEEANTNLNQDGLNKN